MGIGGHRMSEVEKLYKNVGVGYQTYIVNTNPPIKYPQIDFTAEKQIAILQLLAQQCDLTISHFTEWEFIHYDGQEPLEITGQDFTETFAKLINAYWQDLTEQEKTEIAEILRG